MPSFSLLTLSDLPWLLAAAVFAVALYAFFSYYQRTLQGALVRALFAAQALSPETAKSFAELNIRPKKRYFARGGALYRAVRRTGGDSPETLRLYLSPEQLERTRALYCQHVGTLKEPILVTLIAAAIAAAIYFILPQILVFPA